MKYTGWCQNGFNVQGDSGRHNPNDRREPDELNHDLSVITQRAIFSRLYEECMVVLKMSSSLLPGEGPRGH
jgi:hypothetical protein